MTSDTTATPVARPSPCGRARRRARSSGGRAHRRQAWFESRHRLASASTSGAGDRLELDELDRRGRPRRPRRPAGGPRTRRYTKPRRRGRRRTTSTGASRRRAHRGRRRAPTGAEAPRSPAAANAEPMPSSTRWASSGDRSVVAVAHARAVAGADERAEQGDADGAAELAHRVVERRRDALLLVRQRLGDRHRRRAHAQADAERHHEQAGQDRPVAALGRHHRRQQRQPDGRTGRRRSAARCGCRCGWRSSGRRPTAASSRPSSAAASRRRRAPSSRARPA